MTRTVQTLNVNNPTLTISDPYVQPKIFRIEGTITGGSNQTQYFLQLHLGGSNPGATPLRNWQVLGGNTGFTFDFDSTGLTVANLPGWTNPSTGLKLVLSSTEPTWTSPGVTGELNVDIEEYELELQGTTTNSGNTAGGIYTILAASPASPTGLVKLDVIDTSGATSYIQLFAALPVAGVSVPLLQLTPALAANAEVIYKFGDVPKAIAQQSSSGAISSGLYVGLSHTANLFDGNGAGSVTASYKAL